MSNKNNTQITHIFLDSETHLSTNIIALYILRYEKYIHYYKLLFFAYYHATHTYYIATLLLRVPGYMNYIYTNYVEVYRILYYIDRIFSTP